MPFLHKKTDKQNTIEQRLYDDERSYLTPLRASSHRDGYSNRDKEPTNNKKPISLPKLKFMEDHTCKDGEYHEGPPEACAICSPETQS